MSRQVWLESAGEYQADERAGVAWLSWRVGYILILSVFLLSVVLRMKFVAVYV